MQKYQNNVQTLDGRAIVGASVTVTEYPGGAPATVYNANGSGVITQPILTNGDGEFAFYAANGRYQLQITGGGISVAQTITDVILFDPTDAGAASIGYTPPDGKPSVTNVSERLSYLDGVSPVVSTSDAYSAGAVQALRDASLLSGGTPGFVNTSIMNRTITGVNETAFEWGVLSILDNFATAGENVAIYGQGNRLSTTAGPTWASVFEAQEKVPINNPTSGLVGIEVDNRSNGTDSNNNRIGIDVVCTRYDTAGPATTCGFGVRVQTNNDASTTIGTAYGIDLNANVSVGFDASAAVIGQAAFKLGQGQAIAFDAAAAHQLSHTGTGLRYSISGAQKLFIRESGGIEITDTTAENETVTITNTQGNGACIKIVGDGATTPSKTVRVQAGALDLINDAFNAVILSVKDSGSTSIGSGSDDGVNKFQVYNGNVAIKSIGSGIRVSEGANAKQGVATLVAGSVVVANTSVTANSRIFLTSQVDSGTPGFVRVSTRIPSTSFTITSSSGTDTSTIAYQIFEPA